MQNFSKQIHRASLEILNDPGVCLHDPIVLKALKKRGIQVEGQLVRPTEKQVMACLATAPSTFTLMGRNAHRTISIGNNSRYIAPAYGAPEIVTADHQRRQACFNDYIRITKLVQASDLLHLNGGILAQPGELETGLASLVMAYTALTLGDKPLLGIQGTEPQVQHIMDLGCIAFGGEAEFKRCPRFLFLVNTLSPLQMDANALATLRICAEYNQAAIITPGLMFGSTSPITPAGSMVQANAEFLAGACVTQILSPGMPVIYGCLGSPANLRTGGISLGSPSRFAFKRMATQMAEKYKLPNRGIGAVTDAGQVSVQSGYEAMLTLSSDYQYRTSLVVHGAGILNSFSQFSFEQFMVDLEIIRVLNKNNEPLMVDEASLALGLIRQAGPGGEFLTSPHTLKHCRTLLFQAELAPTKTDNPQAYRKAFALLIEKGLLKLEKKYCTPDIPINIQHCMDDYMMDCGIPSITLETVLSAKR
jgi:trimethylamine:corrinoid methyltransferase-like protein